MHVNPYCVEILLCLLLDKSPNWLPSRKESHLNSSNGSHNSHIISFLPFFSPENLQNKKTEAVSFISKDSLLFVCFSFLSFPKREFMASAFVSSMSNPCHFSTLLQSIGKPIAGLLIQCKNSFLCQIRVQFKLPKYLQPLPCFLIFIKLIPHMEKNF